MTIPVSKVVNVSILTSPTFPARAGFGLCCIMTDDTTLPTGDRIRFYSDMDAVAEDFSSSSEPYLAAQAFFAQSPKADELAIARLFLTATKGELMGSNTPTTTLATYTAIEDGSIKLTIDGVSEEATLIDLSGVTTLNGVAAAVQTALAAVSTGTTCVYEGGRFIIRSGTTGASSAVSYAVTPTTGTDLGPLLGLDAAGEGIITAGSAAGTLADELSDIQDLNSTWYAFTLALLATPTTQQILDAAAWAEARIKIFGYTTSSSGVLDAASTTDIAYQLKELGYSRTVGQYDDDDPYAILSFLARALVVNFNEQNSTLTMKFKTEPGVTPVTLTETKRLALTAKNINYYSYFGDSAMLAEGVMAGGRFFDEVHGLDWFQNAIETNVFGYLYTRTTKVPQTDKGVQRIVQQIAKACDEAVNNGLLAPGVWNGNDLGEVKEGDFLTKGYYIYAQPVRDQNTSDREARRAPPIQVLAKGAGAIHFVDVTVTFER